MQPFPKIILSTLLVFSFSAAHAEEEEINLQELKDSWILIQDLQNYSISRTAEPMPKECSRFSPELGGNVRTSYDKFVNTRSNSINRGREIVSSPEKYQFLGGAMGVTPGEMNREIENKVKEIEKLYSNITPGNRQALEQQCNQIITYLDSL